MNKKEPKWTKKFGVNHVVRLSTAKINDAIGTFCHDCIETGKYTQNTQVEAVFVGTSNQFSEIEQFLEDNDAPVWMVNILQGFAPVALYNPEEN